jgi:hypothetical protein
MNKEFNHREHRGIFFNNKGGIIKLTTEDTEGFFLIIKEE